jgi:hypothetical protein
MPSRSPQFRGTSFFTSPEAGGRKGLPHQGYRPDLSYKEGQFELFMIWPRFIDASLEEISDGSPITNPSRANFYIINQELRHSIHRDRIRPGTQFWICEGNRKVGEVVVDELLGDFKTEANQSTDPTLASGTPGAGHQPRHP